MRSRQNKPMTRSRLFPLMIALVTASLVVAFAFRLSMNVQYHAARKNPTASISMEESRRGFIGKAASIAATSSSGMARPKVVNAENSLDDTFTTSESGLKYKVLKEGAGAVPSSGQTVKAHYTGWLDGFDSAKKFDSSRDKGREYLSFSHQCNACLV